MILVKDKRERDRFLKFAVVGLIGFIVDFSTFNIARNYLHLSAVLSNIISFSVAVMSNFLFNRFWTYPDSRSKPITGQLLQFLIVNLFGLLIRTGVFALIVPRLILIFEKMNLEIVLQPRILGENSALVIVVIIVMFWNFFINRYWTYNDVG
ncbi:MAG: GtrA family protein [Chloroflexi bacterium]|jgi:putative flippase GtrA|nr:GtrA family protein [Chloroflexota bacterium]MBT3669404.1 GtrA family protein [Chloroflexota bacterium]MBT4003298.1 GtrA family protein [Chloroflexota bacterium]MBT4304577.1 GtrA family protein [Chloroflexota bacterium]MBT4534082.1 GtrA family protein [Chloroflexota bacterium]